LTEFILNDTKLAIPISPGITLLDFIRYHQHLTGTKIGCREGDCGACTVLIGELRNNRVHYSSVTSCLMPLGNAAGKHVVTIEGINSPGGLNPIQQAMADEGATQCGFCTPSFVMSLTGFCLSEKKTGQICSSIDGNICRCTGYKSIERAAMNIDVVMRERNGDAVDFAIKQNLVPNYFSSIAERLKQLKTSNGEAQVPKKITVAGGTDIYVQKHDEVKDQEIRFLLQDENFKGIVKEEDRCIIGGASTVTDLKESELLQKHFPKLDAYIKLLSSTPIRNMATIGGNFANASPIGDLTIIFLALDAALLLNDGNKNRKLPLRDFYKGYKTLNKSTDEVILNVSFEMPGKDSYFHFEKVSKRTHLDIASVNSAIFLKLEGRKIIKAGISAGGVGPVPIYLEKTSGFIVGKEVSEELVYEILAVMQSEITPISDVRGSAEYKRLLLAQLIKAHFISLFGRNDRNENSNDNIKQLSIQELIGSRIIT
jgi:xanthine dehydrogenase small subunit